MYALKSAEMKLLKPMAKTSAKITVFPRNRGMYNLSTFGSYYVPAYGFTENISMANTDPITAKRKSFAREPKAIIESGVLTIN